MNFFISHVGIQIQRLFVLKVKINFLNEFDKYLIMSLHSVILSSNGLKNIVLNKFIDEEDFSLVFAEQTIKMKNIFAEFISPVISRLHQSDPTIQMFKFDDLTPDKKNEFYDLTRDIVTSETISLLNQLSSGFSVDIDYDQTLKLKFLSVILGNEELFSKLNEAYPQEFTEDNLDMYLNQIEIYYHFSKYSPDFNFSNLIDYISSYFYSINQDSFLKLPRKIQYAIISNSHLQIKNEDSLFDIILQIINDEKEQRKEDESIDNISFLEQIEFTELSEEKLREFLDIYDFNEMTNSMWQKLFQCFFNHFNKKQNRIKNQHSIKKEIFEYIENKTNQFEGIIHYLTEKYGGNVDEKGIVKVTSSSVYKKFKPRNVVDFTDNINFSSSIEKNAWIMYDFIEKKVRPNFYSIRSLENKAGDGHLRSWVVEGSNDNKDWVILDKRNNMKCMNNSLAEFTFKIENSENSDEFFRYLRLRSVGMNWQNDQFLALVALEYFGSLIYE